MTTLNARAQEAWRLVEAESEFGFEADEEAFVEGWETGYKTARAEVAEEIAKAIEAYQKANDDAYDRWRQEGYALRADAAEHCATIAREIGGVS